MVRGFIPDGMRSSPSFKTMGLLRKPSGINPLATQALQKFSNRRQQKARTRRAFCGDLAFSGSR